jgi:AraC-like DNA-binding protein
MDLLSQVVLELRLRATHYQRFHLRAPWAIRYEAGGRGIHIVERGRCELHTAAGITTLEVGDIAILPSGLEHSLRSVKAPRHTPVISAGALAAAERGGPAPGGASGGEETAFICGLFEFGASDHPVLRALSPLVHLRHERRREAPRLRAYVESLADEVGAPAEGSSAIVTRLSEILVVEVLRLHAERPTECPAGGWFQAARAPGLSSALAAIHADLAAPWSVARLAAVAGESRSAFAKRFAEALGESPMEYVTRWRMFKARTMLREEDASLEAIAEAVGYGSAAAFSLAFSRDHGVAPGRYRRDARAAGRPPAGEARPGVATSRS